MSTSKPLASIQADMQPVSGKHLESHHCILQSHQGSVTQEGEACQMFPAGLVSPAEACPGLWNLGDSEVCFASDPEASCVQRVVQGRQ